MLRLRPRHQASEQHLRAIQHLRGGVGTRVEIEPAFEGRRQRDPAARVGAIAECTIDFVEQRFAEAACEPAARHAAQIGQRAQAHALQRLPVLAPWAEHPHRRAVEPAPQGLEVGAVQRLAAFVHRDAACQQRRALRRGGAGDAHAMTERRKRRAQALQQLVEPAEIAQARLHFHQHMVLMRACSVLRRQRDGGREGERGMRDARQRLRITRRIGLAEAQLRRQRERGAALEPRLHAELLRRSIRARDHVRIEQGDRIAAGCRRQRGREGFERQQRQMQADPQHGDDGPSTRAWIRPPAAASARCRARPAMQPRKAAIPAATSA